MCRNTFPSFKGSQDIFVYKNLKIPTSLSLYATQCLVNLKFTIIYCKGICRGAKSPNNQQTIVKLWIAFWPIVILTKLQTPDLEMIETIRIPTEVESNLKIYKRKSSSWYLLQAWIGIQEQL